jgi:hypothetical protein
MRWLIRIQILILISDSIKQERPDTAVASLKAVESLRLEMQKLIGATRQAQGALPYFLEKQKENSNLMAGAKIQEAHHDIQRELDHKDKKIKLGEELVFGQQQAFKDVEAEADYKTAELQERLTRLHMELGLVRTELNTMNGQLEKAHEAEKDAVKVRDELKQKLATLVCAESMFFSVERFQVLTLTCVDRLQQEPRCREARSPRSHQRQRRQTEGRQGGNRRALRKEAAEPEGSAAGGAAESRTLRHSSQDAPSGRRDI